MNANKRIVKQTRFLVKRHQAMLLLVLWRSNQIPRHWSLQGICHNGEVEKVDQKNIIREGRAVKTSRLCN
ncbi:hypothetical protein HU200_008198 [Digitaria exilis]|uniref:Uncharacterized protein n=1 Tax=Digitaria exilis TaxID=1010633 RepID=A0A835FLF8_9POAL|nr:hypothetical protein HU200_008198 [Digitaria exilis]